jgi:predicted type IV restriction endonuclease
MGHSDDKKGNNAMMTKIENGTIIKWEVAMKTNKSKITIKLSIVSDESKNAVGVVVELNGTSHDVMDLADIAQRTGLIGETGMDYILRRVLNEPGPPVALNNDTVH